MLEVKGLAGARNENILFRNLSFSMAAGEALHISAANGIGKSTLLQILAGLLPVAAGVINITSSLIYLGHKNNLHLALTPLQNLQFLSQLSAQDSSKTITQALKHSGLYAFRNHPCAELSAGQCQRMFLARLYLSAAKIWLLDELHNNLDRSAVQLLLELYAQHLVNGGGIIFTAHNNLALKATTINLEQYV